MHKIACQHAKLLGNICKMRCNMVKARQHEQVGQHLQDCMAKCSMMRGNMSKLLWQQALWRFGSKKAFFGRERHQIHFETQVK
jgi:hypothetical protein